MAVSKPVKSLGYLYASQREQLVFRAVYHSLPLASSARSSAQSRSHAYQNNLLRKTLPKKPLAGIAICLLPTSAQRAWTQPWEAAAGRGCLPTVLPRPLPHTEQASSGLSGSSQGQQSWALVYPWVLGWELGNSRTAWVKEDKTALQDLLWVNEGCKSCALLDKRQQPENYQETEGTLRKPWLQSAVAAGDIGLELGWSTLPSREMSLTLSGRWRLLAKSSCWLSSQSWIASIGFPQCSSGLSKGNPWWPHAAGSSWLSSWPCSSGHSLPSPEWKCLQRELAVGDVISPVGFHVTAVNSFNAP